GGAGPGVAPGTGATARRRGPQPTRRRRPALGAEPPLCADDVAEGGVTRVDLRLVGQRAVPIGRRGDRETGDVERRSEPRELFPRRQREPRREGEVERATGEATRPRATGEAHHRSAPGSERTLALGHLVPERGGGIALGGLLRRGGGKVGHSDLWVVDLKPWWAISSSSTSGLWSDAEKFGPVQRTGNAPSSSQVRNDSPTR